MFIVRTSLLNPPRVINHTALIHRHLAMASMSDDVILQRSGCKAVITLNRPKALNALNLSMIRKIYPQLKEWNNDSSVNLVIIKGTGNKAFCAGGDIRALADLGKGQGGVQKEFFKEEYQLNYLTGTLRPTYVAFINGITMGGGVGLSVHGPFRIATETTVFAMPETAIGLFPDVGGGHFLPRLPGQLGLYLALTGTRLKGRDVQLAGVATHFVEASKMDDLERNLLELKSPSHSDVKDVLDKFHKQCTIEQNKTFLLQAHLNDINKLFTGDTLEQIISNLTENGSDWAMKQIDTLSKMSPTSMKVTLKQLQRGANLDLRHDLEMEYRISQRCMTNDDFFEGVRATLIDKDQKPRWRPVSVEQVTDAMVQSYFEPLPAEDELKL